MKSKYLFFSGQVVLLVVLLAVLASSNKIQKVNGPPRCCDSKLLQYDREAKECVCNYKQHYYESRNRKHCVHCPPPKLWVNFKCKQCSGKFREWSGISCVCKAGTSWDA